MASEIRLCGQTSGPAQMTATRMVASMSVMANVLRSDESLFCLLNVVILLERKSGV